MAVMMLATEPVYSLTMLSRYFRMDATAMPPRDEKSMATTKNVMTFPLTTERAIDQRIW